MMEELADPPVVRLRRTAVATVTSGARSPRSSVSADPARPREHQGGAWLPVPPRGAPETAATYLAEARAAGDAPPEVRERIAEIETAAQEAQSRNRLSGALYLGGQYETNANAGPQGLGLEEGEKEGDFSAVASAELVHEYDLGRQTGDALVTESAFTGRATPTSAPPTWCPRGSTVDPVSTSAVDILCRFGFPGRVGPRPGGRALSRRVRVRRRRGAPSGRGVSGDAEARVTFQKYDNSPRTTTPRPATASSTASTAASRSICGRTGGIGTGRRRAQGRGRGVRELLGGRRRGRARLLWRVPSYGRHAALGRLRVGRAAPRLVRRSRHRVLGFRIGEAEDERNDTRLDLRVGVSVP
jgi:hypothetical protein